MVIDGIPARRPARRRRTRRAGLLRGISLALAIALASAKGAAAANDASPADGASANGATAARGAPSAAAIEHYQRGLALYDAGDPDAALASFERAYAISRNHQLLFNIGQIHYAQRRFAQARAALERYLHEGSSRVPRERRDAVHRQLAELEKLATGSRASEPPPAPASAAPGARGITAAPSTSSASAVAARRANLGTERSPGAEPPGADSASASPPSRFPTSTVIWTTAGALGALALSGAIATRVTSNRYDELRKTPADSGARQHRERLDRQRDRVETLALTTDVLTLAALAAAATGVFITLGAPDENPSRPPQVALGLGQVELSVEF